MHKEIKRERKDGEIDRYIDKERDRNKGGEREKEKWKIKAWEKGK